ncbi:MAG: histidine--tRNA ligase [Patescibacteria group bacterium]
MQTLKGFRDFLGREARERYWLINIFRQVFESQGFEPLETPALEYEELLLGKYGPEADKLLYGFTDRGGRRISLRYDQTVPTARVTAQYRNELLFPYKRYQIQPVWRADKPQKGRFREFNQCDIDIIGSSSYVADSQILSTVAQVFAKLDVEVKIKINDRQALINLISSVGIEESQVKSVIQTLDKLDKKTSDEVIAELREKGIGPETCERLFEAIGAAKPPDNLTKIINLAKTLGVLENTIEFAPSLARGLDYYTGMIFEITINGYTGGSVGGGGRYDNLLKTLVGMDSPAVGMAFGFDRLMDALRELGKIPSNTSSGTKVLVTIFNPDTAEYSASIIRLLNKSGISCELYSDSSKKFEAQIKYALAKNIPYIVIAGPDEVERKMVKLKKLDDKTQEDLSIPDLIEKLKT